MRQILRYLLKLLSRWAIRKHGMSIISVVGNHYTKLTGEILNQLISEKYSCRFEYEKPFWDFSIPLAILGVDDCRYSFIGWIKVLTLSFLRLLFLPSNFTYTILQLSTKYPEIINYWMDIISPETSFILEVNKVDKEIIDAVTEKTLKGTYYYYSKIKQVLVTDSIGNQLKKKISTNVSFNKCKDYMDVSFFNNKKSYDFKFYMKTPIANNPVILSVSYLVNDDWSKEEVQRALDLVEINFDNLWSSLL